MAVSISLLTNGSSDTDANSYSTASITTGTSRLILAAIANFKASTPDTPALSSTGLTWVQIGGMVNYDNAGTQQSLSLFRAMGTGGTGAVTIAFGGVTQLGCSWIISECQGMDTSGTNGSGAIVQSNTAIVDSSGSTITVTLSAFSSSTNATFGAFALSGTASFTVGSGFSSVGTTSNSAPNSRSMVEFKNSADTSVDATIPSTGPQIGGIAVEIKEAVTFNPALPRRRLLF